MFKKNKEMQEVIKCQEEQIERLNEIIMNRYLITRKDSVKIIKNVIEENKQLQQRIDKAIEIAKDLKQFVYDELVDRYVTGATETHCKIIDLLEILKGDE